MKSEPDNVAIKKRISTISHEGIILKCYISGRKHLSPLIKNSEHSFWRKRVIYQSIKFHLFTRSLF